MSDLPSLYHRTRVALVTGATGFIGMYMAKRLIAEGYHVLALMRGKGDRSAQSRLADLKETMGLDPIGTEQLHCVDCSLGPNTDLDALVSLLKSALDGLGVTRIDVVIHSAASLLQDHDRMTEKRREGIRMTNMATNVGGTLALLGAIEKLMGGGSSPDVVRIVRPSIVVGKESNTGVMAVLKFFGRKTWGVPNLKWFRLLAKFQTRLPMVGNPDGVLDIIDVQDVVTAMMAFVLADDRDDTRVDQSRYTVGAVHYVSTAYVHGTRQGLLLEELVVDKKDYPGERQFNNSYEESKALTEQAVFTWFGRLCKASSKASSTSSKASSKDSDEGLGALSDRFIVNNVTNEYSITLREWSVQLFRSLGWTVESFAPKMVWVQSMDELQEAVVKMRGGTGMLGKGWMTFWTRVYVLWPYLLRSSGTTFDTANTKECVDRMWTNKKVQRYFSFQVKSFGPTTSVNPRSQVPFWKRGWCF
jgi:NAD(P)-dependent dehydrogenase (short-subunit alcohol dehydrogenase family)